MLIVIPNYGQLNLIPNPSFEDTIQGQCGYGMGLPSTTNWYRANISGTPDIYSYCFNSSFYPSITSIPYNCRTYQFPQHGTHYAGIFIYDLNPTDSAQIISESIGVKLSQPLKTNICYYGEMYVNLGNISNIAINQISMLFTVNSYTTSMFSFTNTIQPQIQWDTTKYFTDTLNWVKISGKFTAQGGEQYLTIGNFKDGTHLKKTYIGTNFIQGGCGTIPSNIFRNYYDIDNISLYELPTPQLQSTYVICPNSDSLAIGDTARIQTRYQWYANGLAIDTTSYIKIKPNQTTTYVLHTTNCSASTQTVVVTYSNNCEPIVITEPTIPNVFTPNGDGINDVFTFSVVGATGVSFNIMNRWGNLIQTTTLQQQTTLLWDGRTTSGVECNEGIYFYTLQYTNSKGDTIKKNGYVTLIR